jgi:hypothetical protein
VVEVHLRQPRQHLARMSVDYVPSWMLLKRAPSSHVVCALLQWWKQQQQQQRPQQQQL